MARRLPKDVDWTEVTLEVEDRWCGKCGRRMHICSFRRHRIEVDPIVWTKNKRSFATLLPVFLTGNLDCSCRFHASPVSPFVPGETEVGSAGEHPAKG